MKILMTNHALDARGGSESYLTTVAVELRRLGHDVVLFSPRCGVVAGTLREQGFAVLDRVGDIPHDVDVIHGQHADAVAEVRGRFPRTPLVFVTHSWFIDAIEDPVGELGAAVHVALNDLTHRRLLAHVATRGATVVRLTQPIGVSHADAARRPIGEAPRRVLAMSRRMRTLPRRLASACADLGLDFDWVGGPGRETADPTVDLYAADIVVTVGRGALEAMAAGRAVLVADDSTLGGWLDESSYERLEADGFAGLAGPVDARPEDLLSGYSQALGTTARALAVRRHAAPLHAARLVEVYASAADTPRSGTSADTIARLAADRLALEGRAVGAEWTAAEHLRARQALLGELAEVRAAAQAEATVLRDDLDRARSEITELNDAIARIQARRQLLRRQRDRARANLARERERRDGAAG